MEAAGYRRLVPSGVLGAVGRVQAASLGPPAFRNCALMHYKRQDQALPELGELESQSDDDTAAESPGSNLVSKEETPGESFVGMIMRLDEPRHVGAHDNRCPIIVGHAVLNEDEGAR